MTLSADTLVASPLQPIHIYEDVKVPFETVQSVSDDGLEESIASLTVANLTPYNLLSYAFTLPTPTAHTSYWWAKTGPMFDNLLSKANYSLELHYKYLHFYLTHILPLLGPRPAPENESCPSTANAPWRSFLTDDFSPFEPSWNINGAQKDAQSTVRFGIEPVGHDAGTERDPFNQLATKAFMSSAAASELGIKKSLFNHFVEEMYLPAETKSQIQHLLPEGEHSTQSFLAFDLEGGKVTTKAYFFPILKALATGQSTTRVIEDSVLRLAMKSKLWGGKAMEALRMLHSWISEFNEDDGVKAEMLSIDCVDEAKSRIKIYVRIRATSLRKVKAAYSLGGRLTDRSTAQGLILLDDLWRTVFNVQDDDAELPNNGHRTAGTIFNFEIRTDKSVPDPKVYLPVRHYCQSDDQISYRLSGFFSRLGWARWGGKYSKDLQSLFPTHPLSESTGTHTYLSFSYKETKGVYMTMYYNPRIYSA